MVKGNLTINGEPFYAELYGKDCTLPSSIDCYFDQIIGVLSFFVMIGVIYLLIYQLKEKIASR